MEKTLAIGGQTYRISVYHDPDAGNPLEDGCGLGTILSLNRRHLNFNPDAVAAALNVDPDAVPLSYYEHGRCLWCVAGELPPGAGCPWDSVRLAGAWLPDEHTVADASTLVGEARQVFMTERARQACEIYTLWCNGDGCGYESNRITACQSCHAEHSVEVDSCWGFFGIDDCLEDAEASLRNIAEGKP